ncbi:MAG: DUF4446 family protein [Firmicutes bacterium]|nr:DUF4446 family protein [Bacillota bacterium]
MELQLYLLLGIVIFLFLFCLVLLVSFLRLNKRYRQFMTGSDGLNLETKLLILQDNVKELQRDFVVSESLLKELKLLLEHTFQGIGVVRFNAFRDTGGDLSFAIAFLDGRKNGVVVTGIYGREESRIYAKPLQEGNSIYPLTEEEKEAIKKALALRKAAIGGKDEEDSESYR